MRTPVKLKVHVTKPLHPVMGMMTLIGNINPTAAKEGQEMEQDSVVNCPNLYGYSVTVVIIILVKGRFKSAYFLTLS